MRNTVTLKIFAGVLLAAGIAISGCKSAPELSAKDAQALIQAKYDQDAAVSALVNVSDLGMRQGISAKYWERKTFYPNKYWADFKLTDEGKKVVKLNGGGDLIEWRPNSIDDKNYSINISTVATNHLKAHDVKDPQDEGDNAKTVSYNESYSLEGVPGPLQEIAHNPGNRLSTHRTAKFTLDGGTWKLASSN